MQNFLLFLFFLATSASTYSFANDTKNENHKEVNSHDKELSAEDQREQNLEFVKHHTKDSHDFGLLVDESEHAHYGFPLPIILWTDKGLVTFSSSAFEHDDDGKVVVEKENMKFSKIHGKIYQLDSGETEVIFGNDHHPLNAHQIHLDFSITKNVAVTIMMCILLFFVFRAVAKSYTSGLSPKGSAKFFEPIIVFVRDEIAIPNIGEKSYRKYMPYLLTVFFFIWFLNLAGMTPLGINVTGNIALTSALAIMTYLITTFTAKKDYWMHIFWMPGVPWPMKIVLAPIELLGTFIKPFALMIRLYANMLAGHLVLGALIAAVFYFDAVAAKGAFVGLTFFLNLIELLVALLQAYIFTMLTALYFGAAAEEHDHAHAH
jgi:F-type H+-transporting ATPase subunit a